MKKLELTALDGSVFHIPLEPIIASATKSACSVMFAQDAERARAYTERSFADDPALLIEWARNDMNWTDVRDHAVRVSEADPIDMEDSWANGKMAVIGEDDPAPLASPLERAFGIQAREFTIGAPVVSLDTAKGGDMTGFAWISASSIDPSICFAPREAAAPVVTVRPNGEVEIATDATLTDAALAFWDGVEKMGIQRERERIGEAFVKIRANGTVELVKGVTGNDEAEALWKSVVGFGEAGQAGSALAADAAEVIAARLSDTELVDVYNRMDGHALAAKHQPESLGDAILAHFAREAIRAAVTRSLADRGHGRTFVVLEAQQ